MRRPKDHQGDDIAAKKGTPIDSVADGTVVFSGKQMGYGNLVVIEHSTDSGPYLSYYGHQAQPSILKVGQNVQEGQKIGIVGNTGVGTGTHLHLGIQEGSHADLFRDKGWINPSNINIGKYNKLEETPAFKEGKDK